MPVEWEEPFGIVMVEALTCGTPVIGFARGSIPEVIRDGVNGYVCRTIEEVAAIGDRVIVDAYERLYREAITR